MWCFPRSFLPVVPVIFLAAPHAFAHTGSSAYVQLTEASVDGQGGEYESHLQLSLTDLHEVIWLDSDNNGDITWGEVKARKFEIATFAQEALQLKTAAGSCSVKQSAPLAAAKIGEQYFVDVAMQFSCARDESPVIIYTGFLKYNTRHQATLNAKLANGENLTHIFTVGQPQFQLIPDGTPLNFRTFRQFMIDGAFHVYTGYDHILFLLLLLLPSVVVRREKKWLPELQLRPCCLDILKIVTAFTVAHSTTMGLAVFGVIALPSSVVEPVIALSIVVAAMNNLWPLARTTWIIAGLFGLIHGFGFASILKDAGIGGDGAWFILGAFNVGIEFAQASLVLVVMPVLWQLRRLKFYSFGVIGAGSAGAAVVALIWTYSRIF